MYTMVNYDRQFVLKTLVSWINDVTLIKLKSKYVYAGDDINSNIGYPSKSYIQGQFYIDDDNRLYLSYILDPNVIWRLGYESKYIYIAINEYMISQINRSLLQGLKLEILIPEESFVEDHEKTSKCRTEDTNRALHDDTVSVWRALNGNYKFIRNSSILIDDKTKVYTETGKRNFSDYRGEVAAINSHYNFKEYDKNKPVLEFGDEDNPLIPRTDLQVDVGNEDIGGSTSTLGFDFGDIDNATNNDILSAFNEYKSIYHEYFGRDLKVIEDNDITKFYLLDWYDYSIKEHRLANE